MYDWWQSSEIVCTYRIWNLAALAKGGVKLEDWRRQTKISTGRVGKLGIFSQVAVKALTHPSNQFLSLCVATVSCTFRICTPISLSKGSIPYIAWCWSLWSVQLLGGRGAGASLKSSTLEYCGKQQRRGQEACIIFGVVNQKVSILSPFI